MTDEEIVKLLIGFISGVGLSVLTQIITSFVIRPNIEISSTVSKITSDLLYYLPRMTNPDTIGTKEARELRDIFRGHASVLRAQTTNLVCKLGKPRKEDLQAASKSLIGLSNTLGLPNKEWTLEHVLARKDDIVKSLNIPDYALE